MGQAKRWRRHVWGSQGDCRLPGGLEELHAAPLRDGGAADMAFPPLPHQGRKERVGDGGAGVSPLQSFRTRLFLTACL